MATDLILGVEPKITPSPEGVFYTLDGHFAVSRAEGVDAPAMFGPEGMALAESIPPERWGHFLAESLEARPLLEELEAVAAAADPPQDYATWMAAWPELDEEEEELARRLAWVLINEERALALLAELLATRDEWVKEGGSV